MKKRDCHLILCYKNFAAQQGISHIGLGVSAMNTAKVLQTLGVHVEVVPLASENALEKAISDRMPSLTHVVVSAPWINTPIYSMLAARYSRLQFASTCHSNVGFLQADSTGVKMMREYLDLEAGTFNFHLAGNSVKFTHFIEGAYGLPCSYLPNLYYLNHLTGISRPTWSQTGGVLKIGIFGAARVLKNFISAIGAAIQMSRELKAQTEIWVNSKRDDGSGTAVIQRAARELTARLPNVTLKELPWSSWPQFRQIMGNMHILLQPSYTESFNMVTADGIAEGVPSVVSDAIDWAPTRWITATDDVNDIARVGISLVYDQRASFEGLLALKQHVDHGTNAWFEYLLRNKFGSEGLG